MDTKKRIVQVYKPAGSWTKTAPGLGDFVRGICHLHEVAIRTGMELRIDVSQSDLGNYLHTDSDLFCRAAERLQGAEEFHCEDGETLMRVIEFMMSDETELFISSNIGRWDRLDLPAQTKAFARRFYDFTDEVKQANAWAPRDYAVLNVRCGDGYFGSDHRRPSRIQRAALHHLIAQHVKTDLPVIVTSDSKWAKNMLAARYGYIEAPLSPSHGAHGNALPMMADVELLTRSRHNYHINLWQNWWSGFSHYTSMVFDVPDTNAVGLIGARAALRFAAAHPLRLLLG